ncbi:MAG: META domain-containing protein [Candidatus Peribacteria bacterium]|jgi:heat shock protein HslJ|nr:META domain-containing protein [Candidatus Peribacteria bacterium]
MKKTLRMLLIIIVIVGTLTYLGCQKGRFNTGDNTSIAEEVPNPLANTARLLREFNGQPVLGEYRLEFSDTSVSTQFCNGIGGDYTVVNDTIAGVFFQTDKACMDAEIMALETAFNLNEATFTIASTRMTTDNSERLLITIPSLTQTPAVQTFLYTKAPAVTASEHLPQVEDTNLIGGQQDAHGCYLGAGYRWDEEAQACMRPWE